MLHMARRQRRRKMCASNHQVKKGRVELQTRDEGSSLSTPFPQDCNQVKATDSGRATVGKPRKVPFSLFDEWEQATRATVDRLKVHQPVVDIGGRR